MIQNYKSYTSKLNEFVAPVVNNSGDTTVQNNETDNFNFDDILSKISTNIKEKYNTLKKSVSDISIKVTFDGKKIMDGDTILTDKSYFIIGKYKGTKDEFKDKYINVKIKLLELTENGFKFETLSSDIEGSKNVDVFDFIRYKNDKLDQSLTKGSYIITDTANKDRLLKAVGVEISTQKENITDVQKLQDEEVQKVSDKASIESQILDYNKELTNNDVKPEYAYEHGLDTMKYIYNSKLNSADKIELFNKLSPVFSVKIIEKYPNLQKLKNTIVKYSNILKKLSTEQGVKEDNGKVAYEKEQNKYLTELKEYNKQHKNELKPYTDVCNNLNQLLTKLNGLKVDNNNKLEMYKEFTDNVNGLRTFYINSDKTDKNIEKEFDKIIQTIEQNKNNLK
jgi:hypothetical protein